MDNDEDDILILKIWAAFYSPIFYSVVFKALTGPDILKVQPTRQMVWRYIFPFKAIPRQTEGQFAKKIIVIKP